MTLSPTHGRDFHNSIGRRNWFKDPNVVLVLKIVSTSFPGSRGFLHIMPPFCPPPGGRARPPDPRGAEADHTARQLFCVISRSPSPSSCSTTKLRA